MAGLVDVRTCADVRALLSPTPPPTEPTTRRRLEDLRRRLAAVKAAWLVGDYDAGRREAADLAGDARAFGYWPLTAETRLEQARLEESLGDADAADRTLVETVLAAAAGGHVRVGAEASIRRVRVLGYQLGRQKEAAEAARLADAFLDQLSDPATLRHELDEIRGLLLAREGRSTEARPLLEAALEGKEKILGPRHPAVATTLARLADLALAESKLEEANALLERALSITRRHLGDEHPNVAGVLAQLGAVTLEAGRPGVALGHHRRALEIRRYAHGDDHVRVAMSLTDVAGALSGLGRFDEAVSSFEQAARIFEDRLGTDHPFLAVTLSNLAATAIRQDLGEAWLDQDRPEHAVELLEQALEARTDDRRPDLWAKNAFALAHALERLGQEDDAKAPRRPSAELEQSPATEWGILQTAHPAPPPEMIAAPRRSSPEGMMRHRLVAGFRLVRTTPMLKSYTVARYRSFLDATTVELRPLTLLFGYNNAGKSALLRALPLLAASLESKGPSPLDLRDSPAARGSTFAELRCRLASTPGLDLGLSFGEDSRYQVTIRDLPDLRRQVVEQLTIEKGADSLSARWRPDHEGKKLGRAYDVEGQDEILELTFSGLTARAVAASDPLAPLLAETADELETLSSSIHWLGSMRALPRRSYSPGGFAPARLDETGEGFADVLFYDDLESGGLLERVSSWFEEQFALELGLEDRGDEFSFTLDPVKRPGLGIHLADTGEGMAQVLPVLVALEMARGERERVLALEQPELHLHPAAEIALGARLVEVASEEEAPSLLVETHSEHLMLAVQLGIARGHLQPEDVLAYWAEKLEDGRSQLRPLEFSEEGRVLGGWPHGVFSEDTEQARELYLLRREHAAP